MKPVKVLHVLRQMNRGGAEIRLLELMDRFNPREFVVDVCAHSGLPGTLDAEVRARGGEVIPLRLDARFPARFIRLLRRGGYSVVHSHVLYASGAILALAHGAGVPVRVAHIHCTHDGHPATLRRRLQRRLMRHLMDRHATDIVACGEGAMEAIWGPDWQSDPRCRVIYASIDLTKYEQPGQDAGLRAELGVPPAARLFLHLGRESADDQKNHRRLLSVFREIRALAPDAVLVLAGAGTDNPSGESARAIQEFGLQDGVRALGVREDVPRLLKAADAMLLPSRYEGLPAVVLEACAVGVPVLGSDLPGVREIAARLSLVRYLPLSASDRQWAEAALALPSEAERLTLRDRAADLFRYSVFHVDRAAESHRALWARAALRGGSPARTSA
jgi:glycosyltransferase involved in cell wall biosynthesis